MSRLAQLELLGLGRRGGFQRAAVRGARGGSTTSRFASRGSGGFQGPNPRLPMGDPGIGSFFKKIARGVKKVVSVARKVAPIAAFAIPGIGPGIGALLAIGGGVVGRLPLLPRTRVASLTPPRSILSNLATIASARTFSGIRTTLPTQSQRIAAQRAAKIPGGGSVSKLATLLGGLGVGSQLARTIPGILAKLGITKTQAAVGAAGVLGAGAFGLEQLAERFGIRGGAGFIGPRLPGERRRTRMNPLNPKALSRSFRRIKGFAKFARKAGFVPRKTTGFAHHHVSRRVVHHRHA